MLKSNDFNNRLKDRGKKYKIILKIFKIIVKNIKYIHIF